MNHDYVSCFAEYIKGMLDARDALVMHGNHMRQPCLVLTSIVLCSIQTAWSLQNT